MCLFWFYKVISSSRLKAFELKIYFANLKLTSIEKNPIIRNPEFIHHVFLHLKS